MLVAVDATGEPVWAETTRTRYAYSPLDLLTTVTNAQNNVTTMGYDSLGRKRTMSDPDMGAWSYQYDPDDNLVTQTDAKNQTITFGYDALSRLRSKTVPGSGTVTYTYDQTDIPKHRLGQRTSMTDASGTQDWAYNQRGIANRDKLPRGLPRGIDRPTQARVAHHDVACTHCFALVSPHSLEFGLPFRAAQPWK